MPEAARITDPIGHVSFWARLARVALRVGTSLLEGLAVAAVITLAVGGSVLTMGCGAIIAGGLIAGFLGSATGYSAWKEKKIQDLTEDIGSPNITGMLSLIGSPDVKVNNLLAARAITDTATCSKDSGPPIPVAEGSDSVWINTFPATRKGDKVQCSAKITEGSANVFIGGNKTAYMEIADDKEWWETGLELAIGLAMGRGGFPGRIGCMGLGLVAGMAGDALGRGFRSLFGYPVNPATGGKVLLGESDTDFVLPGPLPIEWKRRYSSNDTRSDGLLGRGWSIPYSVELQFENLGTEQRKIVYIDQQGRKIDLPFVEPGNGLYNTAEQFTISCTPGGFYEIRTLDNQYFQFSALPHNASASHTLRLKRIQDFNRNWIALHYDGTRLTRITDSIGRLLIVQYSGDFQQAEAIQLVKGAPGEAPATLARYTYDAARNLATVADRLGLVVRQFECVDGLMVQQKFADGFTCHYEWQANGVANGPDGTPRIVRHWTDDGERYDVAYSVHASGGTTIAIDQIGRTFEWSWDQRYNLTGFRDALGRVWRMLWNDQSQLEKIVNPGGDELSFRYNEHGLPVTETDALGRTTTTLWHDHWNKPVKVTLADGSIYRYEYDERGNNTAAIDPLGRETSYAYDAQGLPTKIVDAKGGHKYLAWNERAQLASYTDCSDKTTRYEYDAASYPSATVDAALQTTRFAFDAVGRLQTTQRADGSHESYQYDAAGRLIGTTNALGRSTRFTLDQRGRLIEKLDAALTRVSLAYDDAQRLAALTNENNQAYRFIYDDADRLIEEQRVDGTRVQVEYNANGLPIAITHLPGVGDDVEIADTKAIRTELIRDALGRLLEKRAPAHHYHYRYDAGDRLLEAKKFRVEDVEPSHDQSTPPRFKLAPLHSTLFEYDALGNLIAETATDLVSGETHTLTHAHDELGNRTQSTLPVLVGLPPPGGEGWGEGDSTAPVGLGRAQPVQRALNYLYYGSGHLHQINLSHTKLGANPSTVSDAQANAETIHQLIADIERDDLHREINRSQGHLASQFAYDAVGRRTGVWTRSSSVQHRAFVPGQDSAFAQAIAMPNAHDGLAKHYKYDLAGELRERLHTQQGKLAYGYDERGYVTQAERKTRAGQTAGEQFNYDPAGNLLDHTIAQATQSTATDGDQQFRYSQSNRGFIQDNRVRVFEDKRYAYDGYGRLVEKKSGKHTVQRFDWDDEHRLIAVHTTRFGYAAEKAAKEKARSVSSLSARGDASSRSAVNTVEPSSAVKNIAVDQPFGEDSAAENKGVTQTTRFDYDALGRRVAKHDTFGTTRFIWEGMRLIEERRGSNVVTYVYEPNSYVPLARIDATGTQTDNGGLGTTSDANLVDLHSLEGARSASSPLPRVERVPDRAGEGDTRTNNTCQLTASNDANRRGTPYGPSFTEKPLKPASRPKENVVSPNELLPANHAITRHSREGGNPDREPLHVAANDDWAALNAPHNRDAKVASNSNTKLANVYYFHTDQVGLPEELSDSHGQIRWRAAYKTWGNTISERWEAVNLAGEALGQRAENPEQDNAPLQIEQNLRFQGQYLDRDTGLHYNTFRFYDPDIGRFISPDPIGLHGGLNLQRYAPNPARWVDPYGLTDTDGSGRPLSSPQYSVWTQLELPTDQHGKSRGSHFQWSNEQLHQQIQNDPKLAAALGQDVVDHVKPGARGAYSRESPPGMSWHHNAQDPSKIELIPRDQHRAPGPVQASLHPNQQGGFKKLNSAC